MAANLIGVAREATKFDCEGAFAFDVSGVFSLDDILRVVSLSHVTQLVPTTAEELEALQKGPAKKRYTFVVVGEIPRHFEAAPLRCFFHSEVLLRGNILRLGLGYFLI